MRDPETFAVRQLADGSWLVDIGPFETAAAAGAWARERLIEQAERRLEPMQIKPYSDPNDIDCPKCGESETQLDVEYRSGARGDDFAHEYLAIQCPTCGYAFAIWCKDYSAGVHRLVPHAVEPDDGGEAA